MNYGLYVSAAGMQAQMVRQTVIANNIANAQVNGFKRDLALTRARANAVDEDPRMAAYRLPVVENQSGGVMASSGGIDLSQAELENTDNDTDMALQGKGFFTVAGDKPGEKLLTRDGQFLINNDGHLVTAGGRSVLDNSGEPIALNPALRVVVNKDGGISQDGGTTTSVKLGVVDVTNPNQLQKLGGNLLTVQNPSDLVPAAPSTIVHQWQLESSGVNPVVEMVNMMEGQRAFDANARMISYQDTTMSQLNTVGRVA